MDDINPVSLTGHGDIAVVSVDNPPVNALSQKVRAGLLSAIAAVEADTRFKAAILRCAGRTFIAGADISEFDKPPQPPSLPEVTEAIAGAGKPIVAALHGTALGGGFEVALAARYRVAVATARVGLPEIRLGIIPGSGGTQRLPRLAGIAPALRMMLSGTPVEATAARDMGLIDRIVAGDDPLAGALAFAAEILAAETAPAPLPPPDIERDRIAIAEIRAECAKTRGEEIAWRRLIDAVETGLEQGFSAGLAAERTAFLELRGSPQAKALREAFFAARRNKPPA